MTTYQLNHREESEIFSSSSYSDLSLEPLYCKIRAMLSAFSGRITRTTFVMGNAIGLGVLAFVALIYIVPLAILDIVINGSRPSSIFPILYSLYIVPCIFYFFYFAVLFVKRMHDIGYPGMLILWAFILIEALARLMDIWELNILGFLIVLGLCALPGQKVRNNFGPKPHKKFALKDLVIRF